MLNLNIDSKKRIAVILLYAGIPFIIIVASVIFWTKAAIFYANKIDRLFDVKEKK